MAISKKQRAALRYLTTAIEVRKGDARIMVRPSVKATAKKYGLKEETLLNWLVSDEKFLAEFMGSVKADVINEVRAMVRAVVDKIKKTGNVADLKFLLSWIGQYQEPERTYPGQPKQQDSQWEKEVL